MDARIHDLVVAVSEGQADAVARLSSALRDDGGPAEDQARTLADHPHPRVRLALLLALSGRHDDLARAIVQGLCADEDDDVRLHAVRHVAAHAAWCDDAACARFLQDGSWQIRVAGLRAARGRAALVERVFALAGADEDEDVRQNALQIAGALPFERSGPVLVRGLCDEHSKPRRTALQLLERRLGGDGEPGLPAGVTTADLKRALDLMKASGAASFPRSQRWVERHHAGSVDTQALAGFGLDLGAEARAGRLPRAYEVEDRVDAVERLLAGAGSRSAVLIGPAGSGKTATVQEIAHRLGDQGWTVLRVTAADLLVGTRYLGEWQTRVNQLLQLVRHPRRVLLHVPNVHELVDAGRASESQDNVATMLLPHLENGSIALLGESTPEAFARAVGRVPSLARVLSRVEVPASDAPRTARILARICAESGANGAPEVLARLSEIADLYLTGTAQPARSAGLLRRVLERAAERGRPAAAGFAVRDVLECVSATTGVPVDLLDDAVKLDFDRARAFFESRVMGQPEAIDAVMEIVTLIKAGLVDPGKPPGVFLFVGPTGVGKTELSRALAEYLFGDASRLLRYDMSEFATDHAYERLIGTRGRPGMLTGAIAEHPFSVVLLDEIEKASVNVFDLCLQIFDAGRLTDDAGKTADFTHAIVILTSNVGSAVQTEGRLGFHRETPAAPDEESVQRALRQCFRPEFLNRIDRIVQFRPLAVETAERIAQRELRRILARSGIERRGLTVHADPGLVALLLKEGYSPAFGARPLKRTVERLVLQPLAREIAGGRVQPGSVVSLMERDGKVVLEIHRPEDEAEIGPELPRSPTLEQVGARAVALAERADALSTATAALAERRSALLARSNEPGFWDDRGAALAILDDMHRADAVLRLVGEHDVAARALAEQALRTREQREAAKLEARLFALEAQGQRASLLAECAAQDDLGDAILVLTLVRRRGPAIGAVERLARMYQAYVARLGLDALVLDDRDAGEAEEDVVALALHGAGARALLANEHGLHSMHDEVRDRGAPRAAIETVRVEVLPAPGPTALLPQAEVEIEKQPLAGARGRFLSAPRFTLRLVHRPTRTSVQAASESDTREAVERLLPLLAARVAARQNGASAPPIVRRYDLGPSPLVRDRRTGTVTGRLSRVLEGDLDLFATGRP